MSENPIFKMLGFPGLLACVALLVWNEYHHVHMNRLLEEAATQLVTVTDTTRVDPANEGKLLYYTADARVGHEAHDPLYGFGGDYLAVRRSVLYYQWIEESHQEEYRDDDGEKKTRTVYSYRRGWSDHPIDSKKFHRQAGHTNMVAVRLDNHTAYSRGSRMGAYLLDYTLIDSLPAAPESVTVLDTLTRRYRAAIDSTTQGGALPHRIDNNRLYYGLYPRDPVVGDVSVRFYYVPATRAWCMAQARGDTLRPFRSSDGYWVTFQRMRTAAMDPEAEIADEKSGQYMLAIALRLGGWLGMVLCFKVLFSTITRLLRGLPLLGSIVDGMGAVAAWLLGTVTAAIVIGVSFLFMRPLLGLSLLAGTALLLVALAARKRRRAQPAAVPPPVPRQPVPPPLPPQGGQ